jgi:hypothetical protein
VKAYACQEMSRRKMKNRPKTSKELTMESSRKYPGSRIQKF